MVNHDNIIAVVCLIICIVTIDIFNCIASSAYLYIWFEVHFVRSREIQGSVDMTIFFRANPRIGKLLESNLVTDGNIKLQG